MMQRFVRPRAASIPALLVVALCAGCSDDPVTNVTFGSPCLTFTAAADPSAGTVTFQNSDQSTCDVAEMVVVVDGVNDIAGAGFALVYDPLVVQFAGSSFTESFLSSDGVPVTVNAQEPNLGRVEVGISRTSTTTGVSPAVGDDVLIRLFFIRVTNGGGATLEIEDPELLAPGTPPTEIPGVVFSGGNFNIVG